MSLSRFCLALSLASALPAALWAQIAPVPAVAPVPLILPSQTVQPALSGLVRTLDSLRIEKWKAPTPVRQKAQSNLESLRSDLDSNLPSLLHVADMAPASLPAILPAARNLDALYDVVLRLTETAHLAAPERQSGDLDGALGSLDQARRNLTARILSIAQADEAQMQDLRQQVAARAVAPVLPPAKPCPAPVQKKHVYRKPKPAVQS
jgi:hypothetical protein